jgi:hypothetical protein
MRHAMKLLFAALIFTLIAISAVALTFFIDSRSFDRVIWPHSGIFRANQGITVPEKLASIGRDCFRASDSSNIIDHASNEKIEGLLKYCNHQVNEYRYFASEMFAKVVSRCTDGSLMIERSMVEFKEGRQPINLCTVSIFNIEDDQGFGNMTMSSYE